MASNKGQYLNQENIIKKVFDETTDALRISVPGGISTKAEQQAQTALLQQVADNTDTVESNQNDQTVLLQAIANNTDTIESTLDSQYSVLTDISTNTAILSTIQNNTGSIDGYISTIDFRLTEINSKSAGALVAVAHDYVALTYVGLTTDIGTATYYINGPTGSVVSTLTLNYDGSNRLISVTRS